MKAFSALPGVLKLALPLAAGIALAGAIAWGASRGGTSEPASQAQAATPTPVVEKTPGPPWDPARPDCPQGWRVYNDPDGHFSICYPPDLFTAVGESVPRGSLGIVIRNYPSYNPQKPLPTPIPNTFRVTVYWRPTMPTSNDPCDLDRFVWRLPVVQTSVLAAGKSAILCQGSGESEDGGVEPFRMYVPDNLHGGWVELSSSREGQEATQYKGLVSQIVATLKVP